jgi:hypothetical protein
MPSKSPAQHRLMEAAAHTKGGVGGVPQKVGKDFVKADEGKFKRGGTAQQAAIAISMKEKNMKPKKMSSGGNPGLYANINAKKQRIAEGSGEKMRKVGSKGAPTKQDFVESAKTAKMKSGGKMSKSCW